MHLIWVIVTLSSFSANAFGNPGRFLEQAFRSEWEAYEKAHDQNQRDISVSEKDPKDTKHCQRSGPDDDEIGFFDEKFKVKKFVEGVMSCKNVPAMSIAVVKDGQVWTSGFGVKDVETKTPVDASTLFGIGSVTKTFTSALTAVALEDATRNGKSVSWQTRLKDLLGEEFELIDHLEENVTLDDILTHQTGLYALDIMVLSDFPESFSRADFIRRLHYLPKAVSFRSQMNYNNWMYALAGDATERLLDGQWTNLLKKRLLLPLGMHQTQVVWEDVNVTSSKMARPYQGIRGSLREVDESLYELRQGRPSGAIATSADDMAKWMTFLLQEGALPSGENLISKKSIKDITSAHVQVMGSYGDVPVGEEFDGYGYGWYTGSYRGKRKVSHTGGWFGYICSLAFFPDDNIAVYVATSGPGTPAASNAYRAVSYYLSDLALGYSPWLDETDACALGEPAVDNGNENDGQNDDLLEEAFTLNENALNDSQKYKYIGRYSHPLYGDVVIKNCTSYYGLSLQFQKIKGALIPKAEFWFEVRFTGKTEFYSIEDFKINLANLHFGRRLTSDGKCVSLVLRQPNDFNFERLEFTRNG